jgi:hypothetical protein
MSLAVRIASWLESTRGPTGFAGPIVHWWRDALLDCRPGFDWRYEGIIDGYLALERREPAGPWLARAIQAGDDLIGAQRPDGHLSNSRFELRPGFGGTPHEAAAATGLLRLDERLRGSDPARASRYRDAAARTIDRQIELLWDADARTFRDDATRPSFVPNKACTLVECLLLLADATGSDRYLAYVRPTLDAVLRHQVRRPGHRLDGAIAQNSWANAPLPRYFPYYIARCIPALLKARAMDPSGELADAAVAAGRFLGRCQERDGGFPQVLYEDGRVARFPRWVASTGDILLSWRLLSVLGEKHDVKAGEAWLRADAQPHGGVPTAQGVGERGQPGPASGPPDVRDILPVAGWADKALRYLAHYGDEPIAGWQPGVLEAECRLNGERCQARLDQHGIELTRDGACVYRWRAGSDWPDVAAPELATR